MNHTQRRPWPLMALMFAAALHPAWQSTAQAAEPPALVLQITIDALRADMLTRYSQHFGKGGFRYLMDEGAVFTNAHYDHSNTETIVGHASLATGTTPSRHGMVGNVWFDAHENRLVYNVEDANYPLLSKGAGVDKNAEIDSTQKAAESDGRSPLNIMTTTFSDALMQHYAGRAKAFGVSVKDRGAIALAGHTGTAYWFSKKTGEFVTSAYYRDEYPKWVDAWNGQKLPHGFGDTQWTLTKPIDQYLFGGRDDQSYELDFPGYGRTFPHNFGPADNKYFTILLTLSPVGDELTLDFSKALIEHEQLGQDEYTDFLSISFSSTDYVGHVFGPSSLESEDNLLRLDRTLADLFRYVHKKVGLRNTLIVVSADHGQPEAPGYLNDMGYQRAHYFHADDVKDPKHYTAMKKQLGVGPEVIAEFFTPYVYLDHALIAKKSLSPEKVRLAVAQALSQLKGVAHAIALPEELQSDSLDATIKRKVLCV